MKGNLKNRIEKIAQSYRLHKNSDISIEIPTALVIELISEAIQLGETNPQENENHGKNTIYYPSFPNLSDTVKLLMYSRVQNSNCHHFKIRGQWYIHHGLQKLATRLNINIENIFELDEPEKIENLLKQYEDQEQKLVVKKNLTYSFYLGLFTTFFTGLASGYFLIPFLKKKHNSF